MTTHVSVSKSETVPLVASLILSMRLNIVVVTVVSLMFKYVTLISCRVWHDLEVEKISYSAMSRKSTIMATFNALLVFIEAMQDMTTRMTIYLQWPVVCAFVNGVMCISQSFVTLFGLRTFRVVPVLVPAGELCRTCLKMIVTTVLINGFIRHV